MHCCCCCQVTSVVSDSVRPHRRQPTRLPSPWDSPGKNTGVGCHFLLQCMKVKSESEVAQSYPTFSDPMDCSAPGSSIHGIFQVRVLEWGAIAFSGKSILGYTNRILDNDLLHKEWKSSFKFLKFKFMLIDKKWCKNWDVQFTYSAGFGLFFYIVHSYSSQQLCSIKLLWT